MPHLRMRIPRIYNFKIRLEKASNSKCRVISKSPKVNSPRGGGRLIDVLEKESLSLADRSDNTKDGGIRCGALYTNHLGLVLNLSLLRLKS